MFSRLSAEEAVSVQVSGAGDVFLITLLFPLETQEVVVTATRAVGISAAHSWAHFINLAAAFLLIEEHAGGVEDPVLAMAQQARLSFGVRLGKTLLGHVLIEAEMLGEARDVAPSDFYVRIRTAVARTLVIYKAIGFN